MTSIVVSVDTSGSITLSAPAVSGSSVLTLPVATDTLVGKATTDTLTNKTLTGAAMNGTLGATTPSTVAATTLTTSSTVTHNGGTANGVGYLDGSKVLTTGTALAFNGSKLGIGVTSFDVPLQVQAITGGLAMRFNGRASPADSYSDIGFYNSANTTQAAGIGAATSGLFLATTLATPITFSINSVEAGRFDSSGNLLVGTTSATVNATQTAKVVGGNFRSLSSVVTVPASSTVTLLTLSSTINGVYIISGNLGAQGNQIYGGMLIVVANYGSFRIVTDGSGSSCSLTLSGANVRITNPVGSALDGFGSAILVAN